jgi:UDP-glucose 4-epimerase
MTGAGCLVIGGGGLIGAHLVPKLVQSGRRVTVLGRGATPVHLLPKGVSYISGDFGNHVLIKSLLDINNEVIHLAYATVPNTSFDNPLADLLQNLPPTVQLFSEVAARGGRLVLVSSGGTVYGEALSLPISESHPTRPISPYGVTKLTLEKYARLYSVTHGLQVICVRPANAFGEGQRPFVGQGFIATAMASAMQGKPITIFGRQGVLRDYLYVGDLAAGVCSMLERGTPGEIYNLGSGVGRSNLEVVEAMAPMMEEMGYGIRIAYAPERVFDVQANVLDSSKLRQHTGWELQLGFEEGLLRTRDWLSGLIA